MTMLDDEESQVDATLAAFGNERKLVRLAELLSPACRIEPQLLRRMRLECAPELDVTAEQELWFSGLVGSRSDKACTFTAAATDVLRRRLARLRPEQPDLVDRARTLMQRFHQGLPRVLRIEEELAWAQIEGDATTLRDRAREILDALLAGHEGLDRWLARAWAALPEGVKQTAEGSQLAQVAGALGAVVEDGQPGDGATVAHLLPQVPLLVLRHGSRLVLNARAEDATHGIQVPDTRPRVLEVHWGEGSGAGSSSSTPSESVVFSPTEPRELETGIGPVTLRTLDGVEYEMPALEPDKLDDADIEEMFEIEMLPAGTGQSLLLTYGSAEAPSRILVDGGPRATARNLLERMHALPDAQRNLELLVVTHTDDGSIGGAIALLESALPSGQPGDVWFNGYEHTSDGEELL